MLFENVRAAIAAAPRADLPRCRALLWQAFGAGGVSEAEAETLSAMIEARDMARLVAPGRAPRARLGACARSSDSVERRRRQAASGWMPAPIAAGFTPGEQAALAVVAAEVAKRALCDCSLDEIAARAGVGRTTVQNAMRRARALGLVTIEERRIERFRNLPNVVRVVSGLWSAWIAGRSRSGRVAKVEPTGFKPLNGTNTQGSNKGREAPLRGETAFEGSKPNPWREASRRGV